MRSKESGSTVNYHPGDEEAARSGWYLRNRDEFVFDIAIDALGADTGRVLDVGCGPAGLLGRLEAKGIQAVGIDRDWKSLVWGKQRGRARSVLQTDACHLPFPDRCFDLSISSEMLEHVEDDRTALKELLRVTRHRVVFTVPAHMWLWTDSDRILLHHRRYSRQDVESLTEAAGGRLVRLHPYGVIPLLGILGYRLLARKAADDALPLASRFHTPVWLDRLTGGAFSAELHLSRKGVMPWGHAWWAVVERK